MSIFTPSRSATRPATAARRAAVAASLLIAPLAVSVAPASAQATDCGIAPAGYNVIIADTRVIAGTQGDDFICAGPSDNFIRAKGGDDIIHAGHGNDTIKAGAGADVVYASNGADIVRGGAGGDTIDGGPGPDVLIGQGGNDTITGMGGNDTLRGKKGNDTLEGRGGDDILRGDAGDDTLYGDANDDLLVGGPGNDQLHGGGGDDDLRGGSNDDILDGGTGTNVVTGGTGQDDCALFGTQQDCETTDLPTAPTAPVATTDMATTDEDSVVIIDVLSNDTDVNGDPLTVTNVTSTGLGLVLLDSTTGTVSYDPTGVLDATPEGGSAIEQFSYEVSDGALTATGTVTVIVIGKNDAPKAANDTETADGSASVEVNVLTNDFDIDGDQLAIFGTPSGGAGYPGGAIIIEPTGTDAGTIRWDPSDTANGGANAYTPVDGDIVRITYTVVDPFGGFDTGTFEITIEI